MDFNHWLKPGPPAKCPMHLGEVDLFAPGAQEHWYPAYKILHAESPVQKLPGEGPTPGSDAFVLTKYEDIARVVRFLVSPANTYLSGERLYVHGGNGAINITATPANPNYTYNWSNGETTASITVAQPGNYVVSVANAAGCTGSAATKSLAKSAPARCKSAGSYCVMNSRHNTAPTLFTSYLPSQAARIWQACRISTACPSSVTRGDV